MAEKSVQPRESASNKSETVMLRMVGCAGRASAPAMTWRCAMAIPPAGPPERMGDNAQARLWCRPNQGRFYDKPCGQNGFIRAKTRQARAARRTGGIGAR